MPRAKGEQIFCNHCHTARLELIVDVQSLQRVESKHFKGINGQPDPKYGDECICSNCNHSFHLAMKEFIWPR